MAQFAPAVILALLLIFMVFASCENYNVAAYVDTARHGNLRPSECPSACSRRCSKTAHRKACMSFCIKCCARCLCVPPGTYGHKEVCPCYNHWKTKQGRPKCP